MKTIVATVMAAVAAGAMVGVIALGGAASPASVQNVSAPTASSATRAQVDQVAGHFSGGGAGFILEAITVKNATCAAALEHAGVLFTIFGLAGAAVVVRIRLRSDALAQLRAR
jgi:hypothetical protein